jgi:hypothetical protein
MRRRDLAWAIFAGATVSPAQTSAVEDLSAAKELVKRNGAELAKFPIPMATEPAFAFKA